MLTFIGGFAVGTIMALAVLFVGARFAGDRLNDLRDEHTQSLGIGGGADFFQHREPN
jgi:hypothetical protein